MRECIDRINNNLKEITKLARKKGLKQQDFLEALIYFFIFHEEKFSIVDGKIEFKKNI